MSQRTVGIVVGDRRRALVDESDVPAVASYPWRVMTRGHTAYAVFSVRRDGRLQTVLMHRLILRLTSRQLQVDHRNGNGLDNRRSNLRVCSRSQNLRNARKRADNGTGFKGVGFDRRLRRFTARIFADGRAKYLGSFATPTAAHAAYCRAATEYFREFARFE